MKRLLTSAALFISCIMATFAQYSGSGSGTTSDPYLIFNETQLSQVSNFLNQEGVVFKLMKDLDLTEWVAENNPNQGWLPIGVETAPFKGKFLGNNHKISGLMIKRSSTDFVGFFGYISDATIENLTIEGTSITGANQVGGLVGYAMSSTITKCNLSFTGKVEGLTNIGGFIGQANTTTLTTINVETAVKGQNCTGGFIGLVDEVAITDVDQKGNVNGASSVGGFVGQSIFSTFTRCNVESNVTGTNYVSGFAGDLIEVTSSFNFCSHKGTITATGDYVGGIVGRSYSGCIGYMESCSHFGDIYGANYVGGIVGGNPYNSSYNKLLHTYEVRQYKKDFATNPTNNSCHDTRTISETKTLSIKNQYYFINNCSAICNLYAKSWVGGIIGYDYTAFAYNSREKKKSEQTNFSSTGSYPYLCVFIDGKYSYTAEKSYRVTLTYYDYYYDISELAITNNIYSGTIKGTNYVGSIVGKKSGGEISNNYAYGNIYGTSNVGGVVGGISLHSSSGLKDYQTSVKSNIANCQVISATGSNVGRTYGSVESDAATIGTLGTSESNRALTSSQVVLSGVTQEVTDNIQNGTSIGPSAMKLKANYVAWGWNFDDNWNILETECFPYKKYQTAPPIIESEVVSQATSITGKSIDGGNVYLYYDDNDVVSTECNSNKWAFNTEALQSGANIQIYAKANGKTPSYFATTSVGFPGKGTENDPWRIYTADDLQGTSKSGYYKIMNDINLTQWINKNSPQKGWIPVGRNSGDATYIDGGNHTISGLWINNTEEYNGLFSNFTTGQIKNLNVTVATGRKVKGNDYTGILIGRNANGSIENCTINGDVEGTAHVGGVVGYTLNTTINDVTYEGNVKSNTSSARIGGLIGYAQGGTIKKSIANTSVSASGINSYIGGLVGYSSSTIEQSISTGSVSATGDDSYTGGLVGYASAPVRNSYSTAEVQGTLYNGGLVGYTFSSIDKCYASGNIEGVMYGGGVVAELDGASASLTNSVAANNILALSAQSSWGCRVIGGYKNGAADPNTSNYALSTMQVSLNNVPQTKTDDLLEGIAKTATELNTKTTYTGLGWNFTDIWSINNGYPYLKIEESSAVEMFTLTYKVDGEVYKQYDLAVGDAITPEAAPIKDGYTFSGWSEIPETMPANDVEVTGTFTENPGPDPEPEPESDNMLVMNDITTNAGKQVVLPIDMNNVASIKAFQFDLYLPEGVTIAKDEDEEYLIDKTSRAAKSHSISAQTRPDGAIRMVCTSMSGATFKGNEGTIVNVTLDVAPSMTDGDYDIEIKNIELSDGTPYNPADIKATLTVKTYTPGDVDGTGTVSVNDAVCVINYILGSPAEGFIEPAADLDGNGVITVNDVVILINDYILGGNSQNSLDLAFLQDVTADDDYLYIEEDNLSNMTVGEEREIEVFMNTSRTDIQGLQCDIYLPEGMEFVPEEDGDEKYYADKGGRAAKSHSVAAKLRADGSLGVVETSTSGAKFKDNDQAVFYFTVRATANTAYGQGIRLCNMELSYGGAPINPENRTFDVKVKAGTVSLNSEGYATFSHASDVEVEGAEVYTATRNGNIISCTKEEQSVAAFNGVILKGEPDATVTLYTNNGVEGYTGNELKATTTAAGVADIETALVLSGNMFKNYTGAAFVADKAYMPYDGNSANAIGIVFNGATAIDGIASENNLLDGAVIKTVEDGKLVIKTANGKYSSVGAKMK